MRQYNDLLKKVLDEGTDREGRNGKTRSLFGLQMRFNMENGFPAVTTKKLAFKAVKSELLWFIEGSGDDNRLKELNGSERTIWTDNAEAPYWAPKAKFPGDLGRVYGVQWRSWQKPDPSTGSGPMATVDQLANVIEMIKKDPTSRRLIVTAWNPGELDQMALPPCHMFFQFFVAPSTGSGQAGKLSLFMHQRSCDMFLGVPFNIASYSLLLHMVAQVTGLKPYEFVHSLGDTHIYHEHFDAVKEQLAREPMPLSTLKLNPAVRNIGDFKMEDIELENYQSHPTIKAKMAV
ncbi:thymidylate synthase [Candidatus Kaiserbacteria bacterium RIFCSPHIGHO2_01_FULL_48_10]|uniref:Thymidylate synthase n=1 Tax=Candidatus Kaiserbacteria bacterium RIFCSPHIGHO2_01_FULL_48_10 TaxID=1798476 RepID=A0A1F6C1N3_9BACT|nr:MAG: thymidylate synthase [Candidatus Kaiserbacteria bacterium RIFCSPHIGHO2_01_FULL_48_10]